jgi:hypothetical protein
MTTKVKVIIAAAVILAAYATGRYSAPTKVVTKVQTVEVEKKTDQTDTHKNIHKTTVTHTVKKPDGTTDTTTTTVVDNRDTVKTNQTDQSTDTATSSKEVTHDSSKVTLSLLGGVNVTSPSAVVYGGSISKPLLGPVAVSVFGFTNGMVGAGVGLSF